MGESRMGSDRVAHRHTAFLKWQRPNRAVVTIESRGGDHRFTQW
jgi:hypothetical protein